MLSSVLKLPQKLETATERGFTKLGLFVGRNPWPNILIPLILGISLSFGLLQFEEINDVRLQFTPYNSPSHYEQAVMDEFLKDKGKLYALWIIVVPQKKGSMLEPEILEETYQFIKYLQHELTVEYGERNYSFDQLCNSYCHSNDPLTMFIVAYKSGKTNANFEFTYPMMEIFGETMNLGDGLHGVTTDRNEIINSSKLFFLQFLSIANKTMKGILEKWELKVIERVNNMNEKHIQALMNSETLVQSEVRRCGMSAGPYLMLSFAAVVIFTVLTSLSFQTHRSKPWEAIAGVIGPLIATSGAFGLLLLIGLKYQPIVSVTIFLILAVGVDDVFLMLQAWHKSDPTLSIPERMGQTLGQSGPSITITSLTNALSFGVGILSQTPAIRTFCIYTLTAIVFSYIFQLFLFSGLLTLSGRREAKQLDPFCCRKTEAQMSKTKITILTFFTSTKENFLKCWVKLLVTWPMRIAVLVIVVVYWSISLWGFTNLQADILLSRLIMADSPLNKYERFYLDYIWTETEQLTIIVNNPGDMRESDRFKKIKKLVHNFETATQSAGKATTQLWLNYYMRHLAFYGIHEFQYTKLTRYLLQAPGHLQAQLRLHKKSCKKNKPTCIKAFMFTTGFRKATNYSIRKELLDEWRIICQNHTHLNVSVFDYHSYFADQIQSIKETTRLTVAVALVCMALVCLVFIPNLVSVLCAAVCVISINLGVIGFLTHWNVDLDPISMASVLMSIGFSVDFTAHMSYHYYKGNAMVILLLLVLFALHASNATHKQFAYCTACYRACCVLQRSTYFQTSTERLIKAYDSIGWPTLQSGISTMLAIVVLFMHDSYLITVFVKTVILVCTFGLIHGLFILPVGLAALPFKKQLGGQIEPELKTVE